MSPNTHELGMLTKRNIEQKASELFDRRIAPYAKDLTPEQKEKILECQKLILALDDYSEHHQKVEQEVLESYWMQCRKLLTDLGLPQELQIALLQDIKDYANIEASSREGVKVSSYPLELFYEKKSCDVRLQRHLIRFLNKESPTSSPSEIVRDILEEIEDDVDDISEDQATPYNGNRFLEALTLKEERVLREYLDFVKSQSTNLPNLSRRIESKIDNLISQHNLAP